MSYYEITDKLLNAGKCLTYRWVTPTRPLLWEYAGFLRKQHLQDNPDDVCFVRNSEVPLAVINKNFHYFSNGVLIHCMAPNVAEKRIERIREMLSYHGYKIEHIIGPQTKEDVLQCYEILLDITKQAQKTAENPQTLELEVFKNVAEFVRYCYARDNAMLTAHKDYTFIPERRKYVALFSSGLFVVSKEYKEDNGFRGKACVDDFMDCNCRLLPMLMPIYVPQSWLNALYAKAEEYDWFMSSEDAGKKQPQEISSEYMVKRCEDLLKGRTCICVTIPRVPFRDIFLPESETYPEYERYVLFDDGTLVLSKRKHSCWQDTENPLIKNLQKAFPQMKFSVEKVPDEYITYLLKAISERQKSAHSIYIEMMMQKAHILASATNIPLVLTQDAVAKFAGWFDWAELETVDETHARHLIAQEQDLERRAKQMGYGNSVYYNGLKYLDIFTRQGIPYENGAEFFKQIGQKIRKAASKA